MLKKNGLQREEHSWKWKSENFFCFWIEQSDILNVYKDYAWKWYSY